MLTCNLTKQFFFTRTNFNAVNVVQSVAKLFVWNISGYVIQNTRPTFRGEVFMLTMLAILAQLTL
jgi:hypothetical protein